MKENHILLEPYKVIYKYRNNNRKIQYNVYIFVGNEGVKYKDIFKKIENLDLYNTLLSLTLKDINILKSGYGERWFLYFFNKYHISYFVNTIEENKKMKKELLNKYDEQLINEIINEFKTTIIDKKQNYSYNEHILNLYKIKMGKKIDKLYLDNPELDSIKTYDSKNNILYTLKGGDVDDEIIYDDDDEYNEFSDKTEEITVEDIETSETNIGSNITYDNLDVIDYEDVVIDKNASKTEKSIADVLNISISKKRNLVKFPEIDDENDTNTLLEKVFIKNFVYAQYIFSDDNIKTIKNKITATILNSDKFGENNYLIPSRVYLWSEYLFEEEIKRLCLGHLFTKNNEVLNINVEPLSISNYENLEGSIKMLDNLLKFNSSKIHFEENELKILLDYKDFILNNEIYMIDIYNELGLNFNKIGDKLTNLIKTYVKIYFPKIRLENPNEFEQIIKYLNNKDNDEDSLIHSVFESIYNDNTMENELTNLFLDTEINDVKKYSKYFHEPISIIQSNIHIHLRVSNSNTNTIIKDNIKIVDIPKLDLFKIFNDFQTDEKYPFVEYNLQTHIILKYHEESINTLIKSKESVDMIKKWFESSPYGLTFKIKLNETKYISVKLNENCKLEYDIIWSEYDKINIDKVYDSFNFIRDLIIIINKNLKDDPIKTYIQIPEDWEFNFSFINSNQKFALTNNSTINHNHFSQLCRYFFPYVSLVIEPKKKQKSTDIKELRYGTYLQYKRISCFEDISKLETFIVYLNKKYNNDEELLLSQLMTFFNLSEEHLKNKIKTVLDKYSMNKKFTTDTTQIPKIKTPGIRISVVGKTPENYKITIAGARNYGQMERILTFLNIMIYIYDEIYINKSKHWIKIENKLSKLVNIAQKRTLVSEIVELKDTTDEYKTMKESDIKRVGFKPEKGQSSYSRQCQNSGLKNRRKPKMVTADNVSDLLKKGFKYNKAKNVYEKKIITKNKNEIKLETLTLTDPDDPNDKIYYCTPEENGDNMFIGVLTKGNNPFNICMPCCFRKHPLDTSNKKKLQFYNKCSNNSKEVIKEDDVSDNAILRKKMNELLYILNDTNKISINRVGYLPTFLQIFLNDMSGNKIVTKNLNLLKTDGYYLKYGIELNNYSFINTLSSVFNMSNAEIIKKITTFLKKDKDEVYYCSLNDGEIRSEYRQNDFIEVLEKSIVIDYFYLRDIIQIKGLFTEKGVFPIVFNKVSNDDYLIDVYNALVNDFEYYKHKIDNSDILILIKDEQYYYPVIQIIKKEKLVKNLVINKYITDEKTLDNIKKFLYSSIEDIRIDHFINNKTARNIQLIIENIKDKDYQINHQVIDTSFKCRYLLLNNNTIIPTVPSGSLMDVPFICINKNKGCMQYVELLEFDTLVKNLKEFNELTKLNYEVLGVFYNKVENNNYNVIGIISNDDMLIPIKEKIFTKEELNNNNYIYKNIPLYYELDEKLVDYNKNDIKEVDDRIIDINNHKYFTELYQLFRFDFSNLINSSEFKSKKEELNKLIDNQNLNGIEELVSKICIKIKDDKIYGENFLTITNEIPNLDNYQVENKRYVCKNISENKCTKNMNCSYHNGKCSLNIVDTKILDFIKKISVELYENSIKSMEILHKLEYYVSNIVNKSYFNEFKGEKIYSSYSGIENILIDLFGKNNVPRVGNKKLIDKIQISVEEILRNNPLKDIKNAYIQNILPNTHPILRAYSNGFYWINHPDYTPEIRNLGYYGLLQTEFLNLFRTVIIDWLNIAENIYYLRDLPDETKKLLKIEFFNTQKKINEWIIGLIKDSVDDNFGLLELFILNKFHKIPIVVLLNNLPKYLIDNNIVITDNDEYLNKKHICINLEQITKNNIPHSIEIIYYKK